MSPIKYVVTLSLATTSASPLETVRSPQRDVPRRALFSSPDGAKNSSVDIERLTGKCYWTPFNNSITAVLPMATVDGFSSKLIDLGCGQLEGDEMHAFTTTNDTLSVENTCAVDDVYGSLAWQHLMLSDSLLGAGGRYGHDPQILGRGSPIRNVTDNNATATHVGDVCAKRDENDNIEYLGWLITDNVQDDGNQEGQDSLGSSESGNSDQDHLGDGESEDDHGKDDGDGNGNDDTV